MEGLNKRGLGEGFIFMASKTLSVFFFFANTFYLPFLDVFRF